MAARLLPPIVFGFFGGALTTGAVSAGWVPKLVDQLPRQPEARGAIVCHDLGDGNENNSTWGVANVDLVNVLKPTHVLFEGFGAADATTIGLPVASTNFQTMVASWRAANPSVDLTHQTMSPAAIDDAVGLTQRQSYYDQELSLAITLGISSLNHTPNWAAITSLNTFNGDKLHPVWDAAFELYSFPSILAWARAKMLAYWG